MKKLLLPIIICCLSANVMIAQDAPGAVDLNYAIGVVMANQFKSQGFENLDVEAVKKGMADFYSGTTTIDANAAGAMVQQKVVEMQEGAGKKWLEENLETNKNVKVTESGLQYEVLTPGSGASPESTDEVTVHYVGTLTNGTEFDSSVKRGQPASFPLNRVIKGWTEGVQLMNIGSKYRFYIPHELGYGARGAGGSIPPFSTLIFEVELLSIKGK